jgi:hypothetical protein
MRESIFREKIMAEYKTANHLSFKHIYTFYGVYSSSTTYETKVLRNALHPANIAIDKARRNGDETIRELLGGPHCFIAMEYLPGRDIQSYQFVEDAAFGFLLDFVAAAGATDELLQQKLDLFCSECLVTVERERKMQDAIIDKNAIFYANGCTVREFDGVRRVILKCKRTVRHFWPNEFLVERGQKTMINKRRYRKFGELLRRFLCEHHVAAADDSHAILEENVRHTPPFLLMGETFVRTVLKQTMLALAHAHGFSVFHADLKPDNIMLSAEVHGHDAEESDICVKIIDWGCSGFSKEDAHDNMHCFLPKLASNPDKLQPKSPKFDVYCVGQIFRFLFSHGAVDSPFEGFAKELSGDAWHALYGTTECPFVAKPFQCPWMTDYPALPNSIRCPYNPIADDDFGNLLQGMLKENPDERFSVSRVLEHPFLLRSSPTVANDVDASFEDIKRVNDIMFKFVAPRHMVGLNADRTEAHDLAHSVLDLITVDKLHILKKALDVLVAVSLMERAPLARAFLRCGFAHKVGVLALQVNARGLGVLRIFHIPLSTTTTPTTRRGTICRADYKKLKYGHSFTRMSPHNPRRHLPRCAKLLAHIAGHQDRDMMRQILVVKQFDQRAHVSIEPMRLASACR